MSYTILEQVKIRLEQFHIENEGTDEEKVVFDKPKCNPLLEQLIMQATSDVKRARKYPDSYSEGRIEKDVQKFESVIVDLVLYDYNKIGGEFQSSHSESGTATRNWIDREKLLAGVLPLARII